METILVIDDEPALRRVFCLTLRARGYAVIDAGNCKDGIAMALAKIPDVILCDVELPDGSGHGVFDALKANPATNSVPFIYMTGADDPTALRRGMEEGADDFLLKPFAGESLLSAVDARLRRGAMLRAQAEKTEKRLLALVEATPDLVAMADGKTNLILYLNRAGRQMLRIEPNDDVSGLSLENFQPESARGRLREEMLPVALKKGIWSGEALLLARNGAEIPASVLLLTHKAHDGRVEFLSMLAHDISRRKQIEQERRQMEIQLRHAQKMESIGQLAAGIAHEINTPTQFIGDNLQFLQGALADLSGLRQLFQRLLERAEADSFAADLTEEIRKTIETVNLPDLEKEFPQAISEALSGVRRVAKIVQAMKDFSHPGIETKTAIDLNRAIESTLTVCRNEWKYIAEMETDFDPDLPAILCLPGEFNQAILNIVVNAAHAIADRTQDGGKGTIRVLTQKRGAGVEIRISDTGTGIPEAARTRIFDPFFTTKEVGRGTGQGLAISRSVIVDKHQGEIFFETEVGKGTTFIIRLPAAA